MEALITINGVPYPDPDSYKPGIEPLGEWERNANGVLVGDLIGYKMKLTLTWGMLDGEKFQQLLAAQNPFFVTVRYFDPRVNGYSEGEFYASPRSGDMALRTPTQTWWKGVAFNLIER